MDETSDDKIQRVRSPWFSMADYYYRRPRSMSEDDMTDRELQHRIRFAKASISARGEGGFKDGIPISAATVREKTRRPEPEVTVDLAGPTEQIHRIIERESEDLKRRLALIL